MQDFLVFLIYQMYYEVVRLYKFVTENLLDKHLPTHGNQAAIIWEKDEPGQHEIVTYKLVKW